MPAEDLLSVEERAVLAAGATEDEATLSEIAGAADSTPDAPAADGDDAVDAAPAAEADDRPEPAPVFVPQYATEEVPANRLAELRKQGIDLRRRWSNGEMDDEQYNAQAEKLDAERDEAADAQIRAKLRNELAEEVASQSFAFQRGQFLKIAEKYDGVPYTTNEIVRSAFDRELSKAGKRAIDAGNEAAVSAEELFVEADKAVREQFAALGTTFGKRSVPAAAAQAAAPAAAAISRNVPKTLANMPAAAPIDTGSQAQLSQLATLEGEDFEMAVAKLAPAERRRLMDSAN